MSKKSQSFFVKLKRKWRIFVAVREFKKVTADVKDFEIHYFRSLCCAFLEQHGKIPQGYPIKAGLELNRLHAANQVKTILQQRQQTGMLQ